MKIVEALLDKLDSSVHDRGAPEELKYIARGSDRLAYRIANNRYGEEYRGKVVKIAKDQHSSKNNLLENETWNSVKNTDSGHLFCPVHYCDPDGKFLIMDYVKPAPENQESLNFCKKMRSKLPIADINRQNIGLHKERGYVMIDYPWGELD